MLVYSVTGTVDIASRLQQYSRTPVLKNMSAPKHWSCPPPKLAILATCLYTTVLTTFRFPNCSRYPQYEYTCRLQH